MGSLLVSYDLQKPGQNYPALHEVLARLGGQRILESVWILPRSPYTAEQVRNTMAPFVDTNDKLFVVRLAQEAAWQGTGSALTLWLQSNL